MKRKSLLSVYIMYLILCVFAFYIHQECLAQGTWAQKANFSGTIPYGAVGFSIGTKGYFGTGDSKEFWEWDQVTDTWTQKADFGGVARGGATGFAIGTRGYIGTGAYTWNFTWVILQDFWEWNGDVASPTYNTWIQKANFGGGARGSAVGFSIGSKGYIGTGEYVDWQTDTIKSDFWEYNPITDAWIQKANFNGAPRFDAVGFSIGNKGYIGTGSDHTTWYDDFWEYNPVTDAWVKKANFSGGLRIRATGFSIGTKGYIGTGEAGNSTLSTDFWEYDQTTDTWIQKANIGVNGRAYAASFSIGNKGYIGNGYGPSPSQHFWEWNPTSTSINEPMKEISVSVLPNPFTTQTTLSLSEEVKDASLIIYDLSGREVKNINFSDKQVIVERGNLESGVYFYQIRNEGKINAAGKIAIQ